jgi:hypothetical protein
MNETTSSSVHDRDRTVPDMAVSCGFNRGPIFGSVTGGGQPEWLKHIIGGRGAGPGLG